MAMGEPEVQVVMVGGSADPTVQAYARRKIGHLARLAPRPVLLARVRLGRMSGRAVNRHALAQATLDVNGRPVHAEVAAGELGEAVDLLEARLRARLEHLASHRRARHRQAGTAEPGRWRHGNLAGRRPAWSPRPAEERAVVRRRQPALTPVAVAEAALDLDLLGDDFSLFTETETGQDAVVWRQPDGALGVAVAGERLPGLGGCGVPVRAAPAPPRLTVSEATRRLDLSGEPFVFFVDATTGRGSVAYRRNDGHYGLIVPATTA
jgi:ribosome-associated translation inhibitor RaiA